MTQEWPVIPDGVVLMARRELSPGGRKQWSVLHSDSGLVVHSVQCGVHGSWREPEITSTASDLAELLRRSPEITTLAKGAITMYIVDEEVMEPPVLAGMLIADPAGGPETPANWPSDPIRELAGEWAESDEGLSNWPNGYTWFARWARINDVRVSVIEAELPDGKIMQPLLADESEEDLIPIRKIAWESWYSEGGGAPISWAGGHALSELAPGLGYSRPSGDSWEEDSGGFLCRLPEEPVELGEYLADWIFGHDAEVAAALELEPFDPDSRLSAEDRRAWDWRLQGDVPVKFGLDVPDEAQQSLRRILRDRSERYRETMEGLRNPDSIEGQALAGALDAAYDGNIAFLIGGDWNEA